MPAFLAFSAWGASEGVPAALGIARYDGLRGKSPFSVATVPAATPVPQASFAANWFVSGIARVGDTDFVSIKSRDLALQLSLFAHEIDPRTGVTLVSVNWSEKVGKSTVILRKGNEMTHLEFDSGEMRKAPAPILAKATPQPAAGTAAQSGQPAMAHSSPDQPPARRLADVPRQPAVFPATSRPAQPGDIGFNGAAPGVAGFPMLFNASPGTAATTGTSQAGGIAQANPTVSSAPAVNSASTSGSSNISAANGGASGMVSNPVGTVGLPHSPGNFLIPSPAP